ncbi:hypothetical protein TEHN7126_0571 [Tetragenococcus halophilus subsp. halophilus]|nr:hypothetical protein TEHN7125_1358 [Tetragenococcus halophilus subsp. halophilus]GBD74872.1 hypothetical protein TEHN7126_0571 [Tetragenococcus halophilus subsp. halophilus]
MPGTHKKGIQTGIVYTPHKQLKLISYLAFHKFVIYIRRKFQVELSNLLKFTSYSILNTI